MVWLTHQANFSRVISFLWRYSARSDFFDNRIDESERLEKRELFPKGGYSCQSSLVGWQLLVRINFYKDRWS